MDEDDDGCSCPQDYSRVGAAPAFAKCLAAGRREAERDVAALIARANMATSADGAAEQDVEYLRSLREELCFSSAVTKVNAKGKRQQRVLVVTNLSIYNFEPGRWRKPKRRIRLSTLSKIFLPTGAGSAGGTNAAAAAAAAATAGSGTGGSPQVFVLHSSDEYDYRIESPRRQEIIDVIRECFLLLTGEQLALVSMEDKHIDAVMVFKSKGTSKKGRSAATAANAAAPLSEGDGVSGGGGGSGTGGNKGGGAGRLQRHVTAVHEVDRLQARAERATQGPSESSSRFVRQVCCFCCCCCVPAIFLYPLSAMRAC